MSGVRVTGFFAEHSGFGAACRLHLRTLAATGLPVSGRAVRMGWSSSSDVTVPPRRYPHTARLCAREIDYQQVVLHVVPDGFPAFREPGKRNIGMTVWETEQLPPSWVQPLAAVDELWVPSQHAQRAFARASARPVRLVPHPVAARSAERRSLPGIPDDLFLFLSIQEWSDRKNPLQIVRSFCDAFSGRRDLALLLKIGLTYASAPSVQAQLARAVTRRAPPIWVVFETLSPQAVRRLYQRADAYLSLHRCEGFGLCMAEAMAHGVPVVATAHSGNMDFMDGDSAFLVRHRMAPVRVSLGPPDFWHSSMWWAEPDHEHAVASLRACAFDHPRRRQVADAGRRRVREQLAPERVGRIMRQHLGL
jgi:glycosyltransferase involved in cell wall biosynthesis